MHDDQGSGEAVTRVRHALVCLYGAAAALVRGDRTGTELLLDDLRASFDDLGDVLVAVAVATLERLEAVVGTSPGLPPHEGRPIARELMDLAQGYGIARPEAVQWAAWRLDAVRQGDRERAGDDIRRSLLLADAGELVAGATALLAATVVMWARRTGQSARRAASDLCLAAALDDAA